MNPDNDLSSLSEAFISKLGSWSRVPSPFNNALLSVIAIHDLRSCLKRVKPQGPLTPTRTNCFTSRATGGGPAGAANRGPSRPPPPFCHWFKRHLQQVSYSSLHLSQPLDRFCCKMGTATQQSLYNPEHGSAWFRCDHNPGGLNSGISEKPRESCIRLVAMTFS